MSPKLPQAPDAARVIRIRGGQSAPERARRHVLARLDGDLSALRVSDAVLVVSELVTNSVTHAKVTSEGQLSLELTRTVDHLRIAVIDPGSKLEPHLTPLEPARRGGFGLRLVAELSSAWGVIRDASGSTRVWCELPLLDGAQPR